MTAIEAPIRKRYIQSGKGYGRRMRTNALMLGLTVMTFWPWCQLFGSSAIVGIKAGSLIKPGFLSDANPILASRGWGAAFDRRHAHPVGPGRPVCDPSRPVALFMPPTVQYAAGDCDSFWTDVLSGVPSIINGMYFMFIIVIAQHHIQPWQAEWRCALDAPLIIRTTEEMIAGAAHRYATGRWPWAPGMENSLPGDPARDNEWYRHRFILGLARASGETAPLLFTALGNDRLRSERYPARGANGHRSLPSSEIY